MTLNGYRITIEVPLAVGDAALDDLLDRVVDVVYAWQPVDRDWDAFVGGERCRFDLDDDLDDDAQEES